MFKKYFPNRSLEFNEMNYRKHPDYLKYKETIELAMKESVKLTEEEILGEMKMQEKWVKIMNPQQAYLKFHLPYVIDKERENKTLYFKGTIFFQTWEGSSSTETRLVPSKNKEGEYEEIIYDNEVYEQQCFYHNYVVREKFKYFNPLTNEATNISHPKLLNDYDSCHEALVLKMYMRYIGVPEKYIEEKVIRLSNIITEKIIANSSVKDVQNLTTRRLDSSLGRKQSDSVYKREKKLNKIFKKKTSP